MRSVPSGWTEIGGTVERGDRVADFAARAQIVQGIYRGDGCFRKVTLDPVRLCKAGVGSLPMRSLGRLYQCNRIDRCSLDFHREPPLVPLRLSQFVGLPNLRVRLDGRGGGCKYCRVFRVEEMVAGLQARGQGGADFEVEKPAPLMSTACPKCGKRNTPLRSGSRI